MKVIITGTTGMVGKAVLLECLASSQVKQVLIINRSSINMSNSKLKEYILKDFAAVESLKKDLAGYDACFHCMGISALGKSEADYTRITYQYTKLLADVLFDLNPDLVFNYVSGMGTDSSQAGKSMWARVKGRTENYILKKGFKDAYAFRPGAILPEKGVKSRTVWYNFIYVLTKPLYPFLRTFDSVISSSRLGLAMINSVLYPQDLKVLESKDLNYLGEIKK